MHNSVTSPALVKKHHSHHHHTKKAARSKTVSPVPKECSFPAIFSDETATRTSHRREEHERSMAALLRKQQRQQERGSVRVASHGDAGESVRVASHGDAGESVRVASRGDAGESAGDGTALSNAMQSPALRNFIGMEISKVFPPLKNSETPHVGSVYAPRTLNALHHHQPSSPSPSPILAIADRRHHQQLQQSDHEQQDRQREDVVDTRVVPRGYRCPTPKERVGTDTNAPRRMLPLSPFGESSPNNPGSNAVRSPAGLDDVLADIRDNSLLSKFARSNAARREGEEENMWMDAGAREQLAKRMLKQTILQQQEEQPTSDTGDVSSSSHGHAGSQPHALVCRSGVLYEAKKRHKQLAHWIDEEDDDGDSLTMDDDNATPSGADFGHHAASSSSNSNSGLFGSRLRQRGSGNSRNGSLFGQAQQMPPLARPADSQQQHQQQEMMKRRTKSIVFGRKQSRFHMRAQRGGEDGVGHEGASMTGQQPQQNSIAGVFRGAGSLL